MALETRRVAVEQGPHVSRRDRRERVSDAELREAQAAAERVLRIKVEGVSVGPERRLQVGLPPACGVQRLPGPAEQEPGRRVAGREVEGLLGHLGRGRGVSFREAGLGIGIAAVGAEIAGSVLAGDRVRGARVMLRGSAPYIARPMPLRASDLLTLTREGLYCPLGRFHVDPTWPVPRALITHGHADHARSGHGSVLATPETLRIMAVRYGVDFCGSRQEARLGESIRIGGVT